MRLYEATFWRGNPQHSLGGYETTRVLEAKNKTEARKQAKRIETDIVYGSMTLTSLKELR